MDNIDKLQTIQKFIIWNAFQIERSINEAIKISAGICLFRSQNFPFRSVLIVVKWTRYIFRS